MLMTNSKTLPRGWWGCARSSGCWLATGWWEVDRWNVIECPLICCFRTCCPSVSKRPRCSLTWGTSPSWWKACPSQWCENCGFHRQSASTYPDWRGCSGKSPSKPMTGHLPCSIAALNRQKNKKKFNFNFNKSLFFYSNTTNNYLKII